MKCCELLRRGYSARALAAVRGVVFAACLVLPIASVLAALGDAPVLSSAASRKVHGAAGTFDLSLSLNLTNPTTEPRSGPAHTIVFVFDKAVTSGAATVTEGTAIAGVPTFNGGEMAVPLTGVANQQYVTVAVTNVVATDGGTGGAGAVRIGLLMGDVNENRVVTVSDLAQVNAQIAQVVTASNYLKDVNASGTLTVADKGIANTQITKALPLVPAAPEQPPQVNAGANQAVTLPATASLTGSAVDDGLPGPLTLAWSKVSGPGTVNFGNPNTASTAATFSAPGTYVLRLTASDGTLVNADDLTITVNPGDPVIPPDPVTVAPPLEGGVATNVGTSTAFLYTGANPIQTGVATGTIQFMRAAVIRGRVLDRSGAALAGVAITILNHAEFGQTLSRADGRFDLAVNGGGQLTLNYAKTGFLPVQRYTNPTWQNYVVVEDVVMIPLDGQVTPIDLSAATPIQVAQGSVVTDSDGTRRATMLFTQGTTATVGGLPITNLHIRATEFTVGPKGPQAMPGPLPPTSGYTYAVELSADEAPGQDVQFSKPVFVYVENFLGFPVGGSVPTGYYDRAKAAWLPSANGRVIKILSIPAGAANLDTDGDGLADSAGTLASLDITDAERQQLATLYAPGQTLWRVPVTHFTPWDHNWSYGPPPDAVGPGGGGPPPKPRKPGDSPDKDCPTIGSIISCQSQSLGEAASIAGVPFRLHYNSYRARGRKSAFMLDIPLSGSSVPASLRRIELEISVAGRRFTQSFSAATDQDFTFTWDGNDAYGRAVQAVAVATVRLGYVYEAVYQQPAQFEQSFAAVSGIPITNSKARQEITLWRTTSNLLGNIGAPVGGWSLGPHHVYDPLDRTLHLGDGTRRTAEAIGAGIISTAVGTGTDGFGGDGGPATEATLGYPYGIAVAPDGRIYIASGTQRIRSVGPDGIITTVAGSASYGFSGDGGPAAQAKMSFAHGVALGPDGSLYIADDGNNRIRRVAPDGIINTVAGSGIAGFSGDGGPAVQASLGYPYGVAVGPDGSLYIADRNNNRIRRVGLDGIITTVAGNGNAGLSTGDGGPATQASLYEPHGVAVGPDGSIYIAGYGQRTVRRVGTDGIIRTVAGNGNYGYSGDGDLATASSLTFPTDVALAPDGGMYIADIYNHRIRYVGSDGIMTTVAGNGAAGFAGDSGVAANSQLNEPFRIAVAPDGTLYVVDRLNHRIRRIGSPLPGIGLQELTVASEDGAEIYVFTGSGRHLRTLNSLTGSIRYQFGYDGAGRLNSITDGDGNVTSISRDGSGNPTAIIAPGGQATALTVDANGYLAAVTDPGTRKMQMVSSVDGMLLSLVNPNGGVHHYTYDAMGLLVMDEDPAGGATTLARADDANGHTVTLTTALGRVFTYQVERLPAGAVRRTNSDATGAQTVVVSNPDGTRTITQPDGVLITSKLGPDPRFGMQAPFLVNRVRTLPGGQVETTIAQRSATLAEAGNPLSVVTLGATTTVNGRTFASNYAAVTRTLTETSAQGRQTISTLDTQGRVIQLTAAPGIAPLTVTYDAQGRLTENRQGAQFVSFGYDTRNRVLVRTDAAGRQTGFAYDDSDRLIQKTMPSGAKYNFVYDANGNRTRVILPSGAQHVLGYTANDLESSYTPPGNASYLRAHNTERELTSITLPGGRVTTQSYDVAGRIAGINFPEAATAVDYFVGDLTERVAHINHAPVAGAAQNLAYAYNGNVIITMTATGASPAQVSYTYGNDFLPTAMNLSSGVDAVQATLVRDQDNLLSGFGPFVLTRGGPRGAVSSITDGSANTGTTYGYDALARIATRGHRVSGQATYALQMTYDVTGRMIGKVETIGGTAHTYVYTYDLDGQLTGVNRDGAATEHYAYDVNGNRTSRQLNGGAVEAASYDVQDRLTQRGPVAYAFNADGFLAQRGADTFQYNARGQLIQATVAAQPLSYAYDGLGRRVTRTAVTGNTQYLYGDPASHLVTAVRSPVGALTKLYYDTSGLLIAIDRGGARYFVATDQVGTPRVVSNSAGVVVKVLDWDSFGNVIADTNPGFDLPIGYAGGLTDPATGLVHFGFRDYDPQSGRWTARDPVLFEGGQGNLYVYVGNSPVGHRDPLGLFCISASVYEGFGFGGSTCFTKEGFSVCGEAGAGLGTSLGLDSGGLDESGPQYIGELTASTGFAKWGLDGSVDPLSGCLKLNGKGQLLQYQIDDTGKTGADLLPLKPGIEGKLGVKWCVQNKI